ncbi:acetate--CoA ligase family protein [Caballeronia sp. DA-9]|uniref:acetate--CoA ligase family protein n=1 Tax=Caballeronia sp. DA-9 TaxID=3436237 RepID=UPI003F68213C
MNHHTAQFSRRERLKRMLTPQSAVFVGGAALTPAIEYCRARGFAGRMYVVNPRRTEVAGIACIPDLAGLPEVPDVAFIAIPREGVVQLVRDLSQLGVAGAICNSAGFSEMQGGESQTALVEAAGEMPVIGPNCPGVANFADRSVFMMDHFGDHGATSGVAVISNGGAYLSDIGCADRSLPVAYSVGLGNQAMVNIADIMDVVLDDDRVLAINLYLEAMPDAVTFSAAGLKAARKGVPVVVVKGGRSTAGRRAAQSHTASLAGDDIVASAMFRRLGFVEVRTTTEALETLKMLVLAPRVRGRRAALATSSGSYAVIGSDCAEARGLILPPPSAAAAARLEAYLPPFIHAANPLDIASAHSGDDSAWDQNLSIFRALLSDDYDVAIQVLCYPPEGGWDPTGWDITAKAFAHIARERGIPAAWINTLPEDMPRKARERMILEGMVPLLGMADGMTAVAGAVQYSEMADRLASMSDDEILLGSCPTGEDLGVALDEATAKAALKDAGLQVPSNVVITAEGKGRLDELKFPVVVKALSAQLAHKTELGAVALNVSTSEAAWQTVYAMAEKLEQDAPELAIKSFLIEEMVKDVVGELLIGIRRVDSIGLALTIGMGGIEAELLRDTVTLLLPASRETIAESLSNLRLFPLFTGWRGRPKGDIEGAITAIVRFADFAIKNQDAVIEAEINPLMVRREGYGAVAVDAVMRLRT